MESFDGLDYGSLAGELDFASYDSYPRWRAPDEERQAMLAAFNYDWMRSLKQRPFALMESTPSQVNWQPVCKLKKPGMHLLSSLQAVAHGADTVQYFQWRKSRCAAEKFHGAVVDHAGHEHTRTFRDAQAVGAALEKLADLRGTMPGAKVALLFDTQNRWALGDCQGPRDDLGYFDTALEHYRALKRQNVDVDVVDETRDLTGYRLVAAPMLYMLRLGAAERLTRFVEDGRWYSPATPGGRTKTICASWAASPAPFGRCWASGWRKPTGCTTARRTASAWRTARCTPAPRCAT